MIFRFHNLLVIPILLFVVSCGSTNQFNPAPLNSSITVDGNLSDWNTTQTLFDDRDQANYYSAYDEDFLYLFIDIRGAMKDMSVRRSGFTVYISDDEETRKSVGVSFPPGTFNLLREFPGAFSSFTRESDWMSKPENQELMENLNEELFDRVMIIQRANSDGDASYGFIDSSQLEVDGMKIAINSESRTIGLEMKIPRDGTSIYGFSGDNVWLGFAIEPPEFRIQGSSEYSATTSGRRDQYGNRQRPRRTSSADISRNLGQMERWHIIQFED
ncbi:hypothetical protein [Rhodohalobacter sp.]|uniref:hypothetical protein n=1 Tax=Rhodohalobacter sp. TaxID=1974210 RepID=UPI002ACD7184|nr:hypothetical protein [Rhodohalobacter sp.]MDZ7755336.1 hypothetical protein [Rhodohalobacter sp.]